MSSNKDNKNLWLMIAAGALVVGGALFYHWANADAEDEINIADELKSAGLTEVKKMGPLLEGRYFLNLLQFIGETTANSMNKDKKKIDEERRKCFKNGDKAGYSASVMEMITKQEKISKRVVQEVCDILNITEQDFMMSMQTYARNPEMA